MFITLWGIIGAITLMWCAVDCRERVTVVEGQDESTLSTGKSIKIILTNYY